jgi:hypothetical protein
MPDAAIAITGGAGPLVDTAALANAAGQTVNRQTVTIGDPGAIAAVAGVVNGALATQDQTLANAAADAPLYVVNTGGPDGDFAGVNLLEKVMESGGDLALNTRPQGLPAVDANNALMLSDAPAPIALNLTAIGATAVIDLRGYQALYLTMGTAAGTLAFSNDGQSWATTAAAVSLAALAAPVSALAAATSYIAPKMARFARITATTAGTAIGYVSNAPPPLAFIQAIAANNSTAIGFAYPAVTAGSTFAPTNGASFVNATGTPAAQSLKGASAGRLLGGQFWNSQASAWAWLKLFNAASVTIGTTAAAFNIGLPPNGAVNLFDVFGAAGVYFGTGSFFAVTGGAGLTDATAIGSASVVGGQILYI